MDTRHIVRIAAVVMVATLMLTLMFAATAFAAESTSTAATAAVGAGAAPKATEAPAEGARGEAAKPGAKKEIPHTVGTPSQSQLADLRRAWDGIAGFDLLLVSILGMLVTVGIVGFGAFKQMKV